MNIGVFMSMLGERLKNEREKLGLSQEQLGAIGGVKKLAQFRYESGETFPNAQYLTEVSKVGIDVNYVLFGTRANNALTDEEQQLLAAFRAAPPVMRQFMLQGANVTAPTMKVRGKGNKQHNSDSVGIMEIVGDNNIQVAGKSKKSK